MRIYRWPGTKNWWCQYRGKRFSLKTTDEQAARAAFRELQRRDADPHYRPADSTTLGQALKSFLARQEERGRAAGTVAMYDCHVAHLARLLGEHTPLASIEAAEVDGYLSARHAEGAARTTQWKELCTLRGTLKLARRHKKYPHAIDEVMPEAFEGRDSTPGVRHLLLPDIMKLLDALPPARAAVVAFIVAAAADYPSNAEHATARDIDLQAGMIHVRGTKTSHRDRVIPILPMFRKLAELARKGIPFEPWINIRRDLEVACRKAGVEHVSPRDLRRSHARILRAAGVEPSLIGAMLGHRDGRMVERVYGRIQPTELAAVIGERLTGIKSVEKRKTRRPVAKKSSKKKAAA